MSERGSAEHGRSSQRFVILKLKRSKPPMRQCLYDYTISGLSRASLSLVLFSLTLSGSYTPPELDYMTLCASGDEGCLESDNDGDGVKNLEDDFPFCLLYTSPSPRDS